MDPSDPFPAAQRNGSRPQGTRAFISVNIPVLNERESIGLAPRDLPRSIVKQVILVDSGCTDDRAAIGGCDGAQRVRRGLRVKEAPVSYPGRMGHSMISGTTEGMRFAGTKSVFPIFRYGLTAR